MMLKDKVAIVTGAGTGIGKATARLLAKSGAKVIIHYCSSDKSAAALRDELKKDGCEAEICRANIRDIDECKNLVDFTVKTFGKIDILVNNSGDGLSKDSILDITYDEFNAVVDTNLKGTYYMSTEVLKQILKQENRDCSIVSISSSAVNQPRGGNGPYAATKAGIELLMTSMAYDYGQDNIRFNTVAPGPTETDMVNTFFTPERKKATAAAIPMRRFAKPEDIADTILYLVSPMASYVTGQKILVDGGRTIR